jgi:hypothetical protein
MRRIEKRNTKIERVKETNLAMRREEKRGRMIGSVMVEERVASA